MAELLHGTLLNPLYKDGGYDFNVNSKPIQCQSDVATERTQRTYLTSLPDRGRMGVLPTNYKDECRRFSIRWLFSVVNILYISHVEFPLKQL